MPDLPWAGMIMAALLAGLMLAADLQSAGLRWRPGRRRNGPPGK